MNRIQKIALIIGGLLLLYVVIISSITYFAPSRLGAGTGFRFWKLINNVLKPSNSSWSIEVGSATFTTSTSNAFATSTSLTVSNELIVESLPQNGVWFSGTGGLASVSSTGLVYLNTNGRMGIGTSTPASYLHIDGLTEQLRLSYSDSNYSSLSVNSTGDLTVSSSGSLFLQPASNTLYMSYDSTNYTKWDIASDGQLSIASGQPTTTFSNDVVIKTLYSGIMSLPSDGGLVDIMDIPVTTGATIGTRQGYSFLVDSLNVLSVYGFSNGAGTVTSTGMSINTTTLAADIAFGVFNASTTITSTMKLGNGTSPSCDIKTNELGQEVYIHYTGITEVISTSTPCNNTL